MRAVKAVLMTVLFATTLDAADWKAVEEALGRAGSMQPGDVYKVSFPRSDLSVTVDGVTIKPALALGSWAAFKEGDGHAMAMGDLVLLESEVNPVISALQAGGIEQSALHNHVMGETPSVMYLHFSGHGDAVKLAQTLRRALAVTKTPIGAPPAPATPPPALDLPTADLDRILGYAGKANGGVDQFSVPRADKIVEAGMEIPASMGMATAINFQPTGNGRAAITGDFVMIATEVNSAIRALRAGGIEVTALHSHMLEEQPRLFFMHFWANDDALKLARALRSALDKMNNMKPKQNVLFLCPHGGAKSLIAASYFNRMAAERNLPVAAVAAAAEDPYERVPPPVAEFLEKDGFDVRSFKPRPVQETDLRDSSRVISVGCDLSKLDTRGAAIEDWDDVPLVSVDLPMAAEAIRKHVDTLIDQIVSRP